MNEQTRDPWTNALAGLPESLRNDVSRWRETIESRGDDEPDAATLAGLARLVACSEYAAGILQRDADARTELAAVDPGLPGFAAPWSGCPQPGRGRDAFMRALRRFRHRGLLRVLHDDLVRGGDITASLEALSVLADQCIAAAVDFASAAMAERFGIIEHGGRGMAPIVLAMGKLGGRELNFSSDVDLIFLYPADGESNGRRSISAHEYFGRLSRDAVQLLDAVTADGFVYRVDTRLRPFGQSGPPVVSLAALESYLVEHGREWERYAYVKARPVTGCGHAADLERLMQGIVRPFVYRRYLDYGVFESLREMHAMISAEVKRRELADDLKRGPGGIREIEFIVQSLQLVRGGTVVALQTPVLPEALAAAVEERDLDATDGHRLLEAYYFLRRTENAIQAARDQQTHRIPTSAVDRDRLVLALGLDSWRDFAERFDALRRRVSETFHAIGMRGAAEAGASESAADIASLWSAHASESEWERALDAAGVADARSVAAAIAEFRALPAVQRIDAVAARRLRRFIASLIAALRDVSEPAVATARVLDIAGRVLRRSAYIALLNENPQALARLVDLSAKSGYLSDELAHYPMLLDELIDARIFDEPPSPEEFENDLQRRLAELPEDDDESRLNALTEFKRAMLFRLAVADFSDTIPIMKVSDRLTDIAELILREAYAIAWRQLEGQFGRPRVTIEGNTRDAGLGVIAYGKLAGFELSYGSDLDLVFIHDAVGDDSATDGTKSIDNAVFFSRLVRRIIHLLTAQTGSGVLYEVDTRLRPSGKSGLLVTSLSAFEKYQRESAWTWEHQALLRSRAVAGSDGIAAAFRAIRATTLQDCVRREGLASEIAAMRSKMRAELDRSDDDRFDLKHGRGGIGDIEFLVQYKVLLHAQTHPAVIEYPDVIRQLEALAASGCLADDQRFRLEDIYKHFRTVSHRLTLDARESLVPAGEYPAERAYVLARWREAFGSATG
ncbi:MAG: bifunctional [glutamate--ammonia ligase]-adenylyl-L-tyrosine phosphorylase/[glutamate--ammonia-ligase] adenylyltransferase [Woeseiaceae bacterium]|nr:bifunctional [glutamate--ammonia ligase]-adenylyl-L-tyrosine phosphorylase/[glutamate--ammonia-ligase] adenylyltransferase [Woeseiaceae bacterium]